MKLTKDVLPKAMILVALLLTTAACNTIRGAGRDVQSVGEAVEDASN